jgi:hypothetical protein
MKQIRNHFDKNGTDTSYITKVCAKNNISERHIRMIGGWGVEYGFGYLGKE